MPAPRPRQCPVPPDLRLSCALERTARPLAGRVTCHCNRTSTLPTPNSAAACPPPSRARCGRSITAPPWAHSGPSTRRGLVPLCHVARILKQRAACFCCTAPGVMQQAEDGRESSYGGCRGPARPTDH
eukprot:gene23795-biopygen17858